MLSILLSVMLTAVSMLYCVLTLCVNCNVIVGRGRRSTIGGVAERSPEAVSVQQQQQEHSRIVWLKQCLNISCFKRRGFVRDSFISLLASFRYLFI